MKAALGARRAELGPVASHVVATNLLQYVVPVDSPTMRREVALTLARETAATSPRSSRWQTWYASGRRHIKGNTDAGRA